MANRYGRTVKRVFSLIDRSFLCQDYLLLSDRWFSLDVAHLIPEFLFPRVDQSRNYESSVMLRADEILPALRLGQALARRHYGHCDHAAYNAIGPDPRVLEAAFDAPESVASESLDDHLTVAPFEQVTDAQTGDVTYRKRD